MPKSKKEAVDVVEKDEVEERDNESSSDEEENKSNVVTLQLLTKLRNEMIAYKNIWYPDNVICKFYKDDAPGKRDFNDWISQINKLIKKSEKYFKEKNTVKESIIRPTYIKKDLAEFMKSETISSSTIVTSYIHNYFELNNLCDKKNKNYIIPDSALKKLFWESLIENEIINSDGELLEREDGCKGFRFTEIQIFLINHYKLEKTTKKDEKAKRKKPSKVSTEVMERLKKEREVQTFIHDARTDIKKIVKSIEELEKCKENSKKYEDDDDYSQKIVETVEILNTKKQELKEYCDEHNVTYNKKYFTKFV